MSVLQKINFKVVAVGVIYGVIAAAGIFAIDFFLVNCCYINILSSGAVRINSLLLLPGFVSGYMTGRIAEKGALYNGIAVCIVNVILMSWLQFYVEMMMVLLSTVLGICVAVGQTTTSKPKGHRLIVAVIIAALIAGSLYVTPMIEKSRLNSADARPVSNN